MNSLIAATFFISVATAAAGAMPLAPVDRTLTSSKLQAVAAPDSIGDRSVDAAGITLRARSMPDGRDITSGPVAAAAATGAEPFS